jgi:hypothetical protein
MDYSATVYNLILSVLGAPKPVICQNLIDHLGLTPIYPKSQGEPKFSGDEAQTLNSFYRATKEKVEELFRNLGYITKDQLKTVALNPSKPFIDDVTQSILEVFGQKIWNASSTHTTESCSVPLNYGDLKDQPK